MLMPLAWAVLAVVAAPTIATVSEEKAVKDALHAACEAFRTGDVAFLEDFLAPGFTLTGARGNVTSREATVAEVKAREPRYDVFRNHGMKVRIYGDAAVVTGITTVSGTAGGQPFAADLQFTDTMLKRDGRWRIAASHVSPAPKPASDRPGEPR